VRILGLNVKLWFIDVGFLKQLTDVPIEKLSVAAERKLRTILEMLEDTLLKEVNNAVPDPEKKNEYLIELMKKKSQAGAGMLKYSQNVLNCVRIYRVVKPKSDLVIVIKPFRFSFCFYDDLFCL
jgi:hypothetical protein